MTIGEHIKAVRLKKNLTQRQVAERCGMIDSSIRKYESDKLTPKPVTIRRLALAMDASITEFFDFSPDEAQGILRMEKVIGKATAEINSAEQTGATASHIESMKDIISAGEEILDKYIFSAKLKLQAEMAQSNTDRILNSQTQNKFEETANVLFSNPQTEPTAKDKNLEVLLSLYGKLNKKGQKAAVTHLKELVQIQSYLSLES